MTGRRILLALACLALAGGRSLAAGPSPAPSSEQSSALPALPPVTVVAVPEKSAAWVVDSVTGQILYCIVKEGVTFDNVGAGNPVHCGNAQWQMQRRLPK